MNTFSLNNYPKSYASIKKSDYRLKDYLQTGSEELYTLFKELEKLCIDIANEKTPINSLRKLPYLASGWEWSVFILDDAHVLKIPADIFPEVNTKEYLSNSQEAYEITKQYFGNDFIAETTFSRQDNTNIIQQEYIQGDNDFFVPFTMSDATFLQHLRTFMINSEKIIKEIEWLPDIDIGKVENGFLLRNVIIEDKTKLPKIVDTTNYLDPYRMYPQLKDAALNGMMGRISQFTEWLENKK